MTLCTVASRHAGNVVMIKVILCAASLSLCYTATCYDISGCIGSCWCMGDSKCKASILHIQAEQTQIQWKQPLLVCCFHDVYNLMAQRICINRLWLAGGKVIILIGFPFYSCIVGVNPQPWMPINTQTKECIASIRSAWVAPIPPNTLLKSWTEILQKSVQSWYIPFAQQVCYDIRVSKIVQVQQLRVLDNEVLACKFDVQDPSRADRRQSISTQSTLMTLCSSDAAFRTKNKIAMCTSDVK